MKQQHQHKISKGEVSIPHEFKWDEGELTGNGT